MKRTVTQAELPERRPKDIMTNLTTAVNNNDQPEVIRWFSTVIYSRLLIIRDRINRSLLDVIMGRQDQYPTLEKERRRLFDLLFVRRHPEMPYLKQLVQDFQARRNPIRTLLQKDRLREVEYLLPYLIDEHTEPNLLVKITSGRRLSSDVIRHLIRVMLHAGFVPPAPRNGVRFLYFRELIEVTQEYFLSKNQDLQRDMHEQHKFTLGCLLELQTPLCLDIIGLVRSYL